MNCCGCWTCRAKCCLRFVRRARFMPRRTPDIFDEPIRLGGIAGDQQAALFGQNCFSRGLAKNTYGTGCFVLMNIGTEPTPSRHQLVTTVAWKTGAQTEFALEGSIFIGGAVVQWLRDGLGLIKSSSDIEPLAASVPDCGGVYLVPAFAGLGAPYWDQYARGTITGLTRGTTAGHVARAALEGIAFQVGGRARRDEGRYRSRHEGIARGRRRVCEQPSHAISGRSSSKCRWCDRKLPRPRRWARPTWPAWRLAFGNPARRSNKPGKWNESLNRRRARTKWRIAAVAGLKL